MTTKFNVGDTVRCIPEDDERTLITGNPFLSMLLESIGRGAELRRSLEVMPVPTGLVVATGVTFHVAEIDKTAYDMVLVDLIDGRKNVPFQESSLELVQSFDDELTAVLQKGNTE